MSEHDSAAWTGSEEDREGPTLMEMINKYVPTVTRAEVTAMALTYEKEITGLLRQYHELVMQYEGAMKHLEELQSEYAQATMVKLPSTGVVQAESVLEPISYDHHIRLAWMPDPRHATIVVPRTAAHPEDSPRLFEAALIELRRMFEHDIPRQVEREYIKMCEHLPRD